MKRASLLCIVAVLALVGCSKPNKFVGNWEGTTTVQGQTATVTQNLNADKTFTGSFSMELGPMGKISADVNGTWDSKSDTELSTTLNGVTVKDAPAMVKDQFEKSMLEDKGKAMSTTVKWNGDDEFTSNSPKGGSMTFKRKK